MGYTHYFEIKVPKGVKASVLEEKYQNAIKECAKLARVWNIEHAKGSSLDGERLSGFSAHTAPKQAYGGLQLNGKGENAHEPFEMREHFKQNIENGNGFAFCKTARKPYDTVVVACLAILKYRLGNAIKVSSDGDRADWNEGVKLASKVIRRKVPNPIGELELIVENGRKLKLVKV